MRVTPDGEAIAYGRLRQRQRRETRRFSAPSRELRIADAFTARVPRR
jgi:hypothetical protein